MPFFQSGSIRYFCFASLENPRLYHAIFTRNGGVSPAPWESLNFGGSVGDDQSHVVENRRRAFEAIGVEINSLYDVYQVHSSEVVFTDKPRSLQSHHLKADAIVTNQPNITLLMRFADCVPILLFDPVRYVTGIIHAGWKGTISEIASKVIIAMAGRYGSKPADIQAAIGPSIGPDHYSVGVEVIDKVKITFGQDAESLLYHDDDGVKFDLWAANQLILVKSGVKNIEISGLCTACNQYDWFSHRGERGNTGRFGAVIGLRI